MIGIRLVMQLENGKFIAIEESEVENLALETIGTSENIYTGETPINEDFYLKFDPDMEAWPLYNKHNN